MQNAKITLVTKVLSYGEVGYAIICKYENVINMDLLSKSTFTVETKIDGELKPRTITNIYTNNQPRLTYEPTKGSYIIIELDPTDSHTSTLGFDSEKFLTIKKDIEYYITQKSDLKTEDGEIIKANHQKIKHQDKMTLIVDDFEHLTHSDISGNELPYSIYKPAIKQEEKYPLVIFLHGTGERGYGDKLQLLGNEGAIVWAKPEVQKRNPCFVLAPQAPYAQVLNAYWTKEPIFSLVKDLITKTIKEQPIDPNRVYITGISNGGVGTWYHLRENPELFAAAVPICGFTNYDDEFFIKRSPDIDDKTVGVLKDKPIWVFHAEDDPLVDVKNGRKVVEAIKNAGNTKIHYTEYPKGQVQPNGHLSWVLAYKTQEMIDWLFKQKR